MTGVAGRQPMSKRQGETRRGAEAQREGFNRAAIVIVLLLYLLTGGLFAVYTPDWQAPDEPAHYNYIRQLAAGRLPVIEAGDYDQSYIEQIVGSGLDPQYSIESLRYEDWQPPLYYLLQTPVYLLSGGSITTLRLFSVLIGAGVVWLAYRVGRQLFPARPYLALATAVFVAFLPQHIAILASVNNDSLAELLIAAILLLLVTPVARLGVFNLNSQAGDLANRATGFEQTRLLLIGFLLGLGFLTKGTAYLMAPVVGITLLIRYWREWDRLVRAILLVFVPAFLLGALWWGRNLLVYGGLDVLGKAAHDAVVVGQPRTAEWIAQYGLMGTIGRFLQTTFTSFWGQFGWMALPFQGWTLYVVAGVTLLALLGLLLGGGAEEQGRRGDRSLIVLIFLFLLALGLHIGYNLTFVQHQGRYLFPALIPIAAGVAWGLAFWLRPLIRRWAAAGYLLPIGLSVVLIPLAWYSLFRIIIPEL